MELPFLKIEFTGKKIPGTDQDEMRFQLKGDPVLLTKAIRTVKQAKQEIAAAMMAAVIDYCNQEKIDCGELKNMVKFH
jgi:hypothetical protein